MMAECIIAASLVMLRLRNIVMTEADKNVNIAVYISYFFIYISVSLICYLIHIFLKLFV